MACCGAGRRRGHIAQHTYKQGEKLTPRPGKRTAKRAAKRAARRQRR